MPLLDVGWTRGSTTLNIRGDLGNGWRKTGPKFKFSEKDLIECSGHAVRVMLDVYAYPHSIVVNEFPRETAIMLVEGGISHNLKNGRVELDVPLFVEEKFRDLPWKFTNKRKLAINKNYLPQ